MFALDLSYPMRNPTDRPTGNRMAIIAGTSCCHMLLLENEHFVNGVWGPYKNAVLKNMHLLEGGQTSAGSTLDWLVTLTGKSIDNLGMI